MATTVKLPERKRTASSISAMRLLADQTFSRVAGAPLIGGNSLRVLKDAAENYPAWLDAISKAQYRVFFETYMIRDDSEGEKFAEALIEKAREGVKVYLIYDWVGAFLKTSNRFWNRLRKEGVQIRCFNPPKLSSPMAWIMRDHRKALVVDNKTAFVSGLCVGCVWSGNPKKGIEPWRDTGIGIRGPAVMEIARAFGRTWAATGEPLPDEILYLEEEPVVETGNVNLRVIATEPETAGMFRLDQLVSAIARERLYISDAYFAGTTAYVQALVSAANDDVDVRLLVPGTSDIAVISPLTRVGYRPLLEGGVRIYEWNGPMMHAKTAVADGKWARIGSTNLNVVSWTGNWELDIAAEDESFARQMEEMFVDDLTKSTEIVLKERRLVRQIQQDAPRFKRRRRGSRGRVVAGALSIGRAIDAAVTNRRDFSRTEARALLTAAFAFLGLALLLYFFPKIIVIPVSVFLIWTGLALAVRAVRLLRKNGSPDKSSVDLTTPQEGSAGVPPA
jgi:cardiolipin synthase A/B